MYIVCKIYNTSTISILYMYHLYLFLIMKVFLAVCDCVYSKHRLHFAAIPRQHPAQVALEVLASGNRKRPASKVNLSTMYDSELEITAVTILEFCKCILPKSSCLELPDMIASKRLLVCLVVNMPLLVRTLVRPPSLQTLNSVCAYMI